MVSLHMGMLNRPGMYLALLMTCSLGLSGLYGQSPRRNTPADEGEDDVVETVKVNDKPNAAGTGSGEQEGVILAPEFVPEPGEPAKKDFPAEAPAQEAVDDPADPPPVNGGRTDAASETFATPRVNARTMSLCLPAPRGQILDRHGEPLAQTRVAYQLALRFGQFENEERDYVIGFARQCLAEAAKIGGVELEGEKTLSDENLWQHYRHRRWLPLPVSLRTTSINAEQAEKIKDKVTAIRGLELLPVYVRYYPEGKTAAHIVGYAGSKGRLPTGPINHMDPLWELTEGRSGLEAAYDGELTGRPGVWRLMFDEEGTKILDELQVKPRPGGSLVTTIDLKWQKIAEKCLAKGAHRGAMVVLDCKSGEILVMASTPSYDPNLFIPNISQKAYNQLRDDPAGPLVSRAFQGVYPPASTFKVVTVLSALANGTLTENQLINCPYSITIGRHEFRNHSKTPAGSINCVRAIALSNNPFMYQVGLNLDGRGGRNSPLCARILLDAARKLGFGSKTGLPIPDQAGLVPTEEYMLNAPGIRRNFMQGDIANMSIGQGVLLATPLQVAHAMSGIANGHSLPKLHIIKQVQDENANVIGLAVPETQTLLTEYEAAAVIVRKGMKAVVEGGTGSRSRLSYTSMAGKTGTAQWGSERENKRLAWFAGYLPCENPRFAYAVLYEGLPHQRISGSGKAGPIAKEFFEAVKDDVKALLKPKSDDDIPVAEPVEDDSPANPAGVPDGLPPGFYEPGDSDPVPTHAIPLDADDSADNPGGFEEVSAPVRREGIGPAPVPQPGDSDYIPGLRHQIPRHLTRHTAGQGDEQTADALPDDALPIAEPVVED